MRAPFLKEKTMRNLHPWVKVDQAVRPLPPKSLNILVGLTLKHYRLCITVSVVENIWTFWFVLEYFVLLAWKVCLVGIAEM